MPVSETADKKADKPADGCDSHHILAHSVSCAKIFVCFLEPNDRIAVLLLRRMKSLLTRSGHASRVAQCPLL
jgi:hypothetical protein